MRPDALNAIEEEVVYSPQRQLSSRRVSSITSLSILVIEASQERQRLGEEQLLRGRSPCAVRREVRTTRHKVER
ncbi:hypothetical protein Hamer_G001166 [Homarus americanus]|uniref:Uncharacterized protein n=1 Tax=Homarus americanus TaxID=6706 RepID=A0A8J5TLZ9_HOMAM|nr:hypothetical protein Hamer_G001166 [Homarus americanus]